jgi:predicted RNA-binding protein with EMAP domain
MPEDDTGCKHTPLEIKRAIEQDVICPLCLADEVLSLRLHASVDPLAMKMVQQENAVLWKVIALLGGRD